MSALKFAALVFMSNFLAALAGVQMQRVLPDKQGQGGRRHFRKR